MKPEDRNIVVGLIVVLVAMLCVTAIIVAWILS